MSKSSRRDFIKTSVIAGAGLFIGGTFSRIHPFAQVAGANGDIRVAIAGLRSKGRNHIDNFSKVSGVRITALCDPDSEILAGAMKKVQETNPSVEGYADIRKLLEDDSIDALVIATPNHWHSLMTIWACQAGKDVYVEKPVSHNPYEGRQMVKAARKYDRIVQTGTQKRSDEGLAEAFAYLQSGALGKITLARGYCYRRRGGIGLVDGPQSIPEHINYDLWCGPAPKEPLMRKNLHYDWHWLWSTGNGDIGNQGVHEVDLCRWALGETGLPKRVMSVGGRYGFVDDGETPNTQISLLEYDEAPMLFEVRNLPMEKGSRSMDHYKGTRVGIVIECENGYFVGGGGGGWTYDNEGERLQQFKGGGGSGHVQNFINAVRSRKCEDLNAEIEEGHISSALCHLANASYRVGVETPPAEIGERLQDFPAAQEALLKISEHLANNEVDISVKHPKLGPWLEVNTERENFSGGTKFEQANGHLIREYRKPYVVEEQV